MPELVHVLGVLALYFACLAPILKLARAGRVPHPEPPPCGPVAVRQPRRVEPWELT